MPHRSEEFFARMSCTVQCSTMKCMGPLRDSLFLLLVQLYRMRQYAAQLKPIRKERGRISYIVLQRRNGAAKLGRSVTVR